MNVLKLLVKVYFGAYEAVWASVIEPEILPEIVPSTDRLPEINKSLEISPDPDTESDPDMCASNIFI